MRLKDRIAVVTGSGRGIGEAIAMKMAEEGAHVVVSDVMVDDAERVAEAIRGMGRRALVVKTDVSNKESVQAMVDRTLQEFGRLDILVNNAGITRDALLHKMTEEQWDAVIAVNLKGVFLCSQAASRPMVEQQYGKIINISSRGMLGNVGQANYSASKAGVAGLTRTLALELARYNINVNAVAPGFIDTPMTQAIPDKVKEKFISSIPLRRIGQPRDIANVVTFLATEEASYVTGQVIFVCGGRSIGAAAL